MILEPPAIYDHPYSGPVIERIVTAAEVERMCGGNIQACILFKPNFYGDSCFVVLPVVGRGGTNQRSQNMLRRHEIGHCNGWGLDHAGAR